MNKEEHKDMNKEEFDRETCQFKSRFDLLLFLLNTLPHIFNNGCYYCHWGEEKKKKRNKYVWCVKYQ